MGYQRKKSVVIKWGEDQGELSGLEVRALRMSVRKFLRLAPLLEADLENFTPEEITQMEALFEEFGKQLLSWNIEDEDTGAPVPCTVEDLLNLDIALVSAIITAYGQSLVGVSDPLGRSSDSGASPLEASLPMVPLSESRAS